MNCRPGDLAVVIRTTHGEQVGKIVRCIHLIRGYYGGPRHESDAWETEPMLTNGTWLVPCPDAWLRPIRDPGDDAVDETLVWLPSPSREKEEA